MKIIDDLLRIKRHREDQAESRLAEASRFLIKACETLQQAKVSLEQAHLKHDAREAELYADLFSRVVQLGEIDIARFELEKMHEVIKECELALQSAEEEYSTAEENKEKMREQYRDAFRARSKYSELSLQSISEKRQLEQFKEDSEMEEVVTSNHARTDYSQNNPEAAA